MDKNCETSHFETSLPLNKDIYVPSREERQLGDFGYADEDDPRKLGWVGEDLTDENQDIICHEQRGQNKHPKKITEKQLDDYVDQNGCSYVEAYRHFNATPDDVEWDQVDFSNVKINQIANNREINLNASIDSLKPDVNPGPSVNLGDRHLAIDALMDIYNTQSKAQGAQLRGFDRMSNTYGYTEANRIVKNMEHKSSVADRQIDHHIDTLMATTALKNAGYNINEIMGQKEALRRDLQDHFGPGHANYKDREKLVRKVRPPQEKTKSSRKKTPEN